MPTPTAPTLPHPGPWVRLCKRTEDPKLAWLQRRFAELGIPSRRNGESWHAPILEVPKEHEAAAWAYLASPFDGEPEGSPQTVDDVDDDDPVFSCEDGTGPAVTETAETAPTIPHTPGPWALADDAGSTFCYEVRATSPDGHSAGIALVYAHGGPKFMDATAEDTANARLLAAAPDLLAALRALVDRCDTTELADGSSIDTLAAHMAIRAATGDL